MNIIIIIMACDDVSIQVYKMSYPLLVHFILPFYSNLIIYPPESAYRDMTAPCMLANKRVGTTLVWGQSPGA